VREATTSRNRARVLVRSPTRFATALAIAGLACSLGSCGGSAPKPPAGTSTASYSTLVHAGIHLLDHGQTSAAEQLFQQAAVKNPRDPVAHYDLGVIFQQDGDRPGAFKEYKLAILADPRYVPALYNEAVLQSAHNAPLAIFYYRQVIRMQPDSPTALLNLGLLQDQTRAQRHQAVADLRRAVRLDPALGARIPASVRRGIGAPLSRRAQRR
jgi:tetratricopeptide (TPR) repeat protein